MPHTHAHAPLYIYMYQYNYTKSLPEQKIKVNTALCIMEKKQTEQIDKQQLILNNTLWEKILYFQQLLIIP